MKKISFYLLSLVLLIGCSRYGEDEIWIIPENYTGYLAWTSNAPNPVSVEYEDGWRLYRFPNNGVLSTEFRFNHGWHDAKYYIIDSQGNQKRIQAISSNDIQALKEGELYVRFGASSFDSSNLKFSPYLYTWVIRKGEEDKLPNFEDWIKGWETSNKSVELTSEAPPHP